MNDRCYPGVPLAYDPYVARAHGSGSWRVMREETHLVSIGS